MWVKEIASSNPLAYGVGGLREALIGFSLVPMNIDPAVLVAVSTVIMTIAGHLLSKAEV